MPPVSPVGGVLMYGAMLLFEDELIHVVSISFTSLILTELLMVGLTVRTWHPLMVVAQFISLGFYALSVIFMHYFGELECWGSCVCEDVGDGVCVCVF